MKNSIILLILPPLIVTLTLGACAPFPAEGNPPNTNPGTPSPRVTGSGFTEMAEQTPQMPIKPSASLPATNTDTPMIIEQTPIVPNLKIETPQVTNDDLAQLVEGNNNFAFDLYQALLPGSENLFYSPYSISLALAMTYAGAKADTEQQISEALHFNLPQDRFHLTFNVLNNMLTSRGENIGSEDERAFRLNIANALWGKKDFSFLPVFLELLAQNYGAGMQQLDFANAAEEARITINDWISEQTEGKITDLIPQGAIHSLTRLVLTNAIYFNAAWNYPFEPDQTEEASFYLLDGSEIMVPMMRQSESLLFTEGDGFQALTLPYEVNEISMVILLPAKSQFENFESSLSAAQVASLIKNLSYKQIDLYMPRFKFDSEFKLSSTLSEMGMPEAFSREADFSGMTGTLGLFIDEVIHKALISVDEAGTEAAAATAVVVSVSSAPTEVIEVNINRPYIFFIRDNETGAILFVGRVLNP